VPAESPAVLAVTDTPSGAVPDVGESLSQLASSLTVYDSVPPPVFDTLSDSGAGSSPPATPANERLDGETDSAGDGGVVMTSSFGPVACHSRFLNTVAPLVSTAPTMIETSPALPATIGVTSIETQAGGSDQAPV